MPIPRPRPGAPDFLTDRDSVIDFAHTAIDRHRDRGDGTCLCGWQPGIFGGHTPTHTAHAEAMFTLELAERLPSDTTDPDGGTWNLIDLIEQLYERLDDAHRRADQHDYGDALLAQTADHMQQAANYIKTWYTAHYPGPDTYHVGAHRSGTVWELHIDHIGTTRARTADTAETIIRDTLACNGGNPDAELRITWHPTGTTTTHTRNDTDTMPAPLDPTTATRLELDDYYHDFATTFAASTEFWKLERGQRFAEPSNPAWQAFNNGDWETSMRLLDRYQADVAAVHRRNLTTGTTARRIRIVTEPLTPYMRWELELLHRRDHVTGGIRTIDAIYLEGLEPDGTELPDLNITDTCAYHVIYDNHGVISHALKYTDHGAILPWRNLTRRLWQRGTAIGIYYTDHVKDLPAPTITEHLPDNYLKQHGRPDQPMS